MQELMRVTMDARVRGGSLSDVNDHGSGKRCRNGHLLDDANTYWRSGRRVCKECGRIASREYKRRRREIQGALGLKSLVDRVSGSAEHLALALGRFRSGYQTDPATGCWIWQRATNGKGYGQFTLMGRTVLAHRAAYFLLVGEVPDGLDLDHLCRQRGCVNPSHLEPVTNRENALRGEGPTAKNAAKTHCLRGHALTPDNLVPSEIKRGYRICRDCAHTRAKARYA